MPTSMQCATCARYRGLNDKFRPSCDAYPDGIPEGIITGLVDHRLPQDGDGGLGWVPIDAAAEAMMADDEAAQAEATV